MGFCSVLIDTVKQFSKAVAPISIPTGEVRELHILMLNKMQDVVWFILAILLGVSQFLIVVLIAFP